MTSIIRENLYMTFFLPVIFSDFGHGERVKWQGEGYGHHPEGGQGQEASRGCRDVRSIR